MLGNYFLNIRYCTSNLVIALLQIASEVTTDVERVLAALEKTKKVTRLSQEKGQNSSLASHEMPWFRKECFSLECLRHKLVLRHKLI